MKTENPKYQGLTTEEVVKNLSLHGSNQLTPPKKTPLWRLFIEKFEDPIIRILIIAALLSLVISVIHGEYAETIGIFFAIFLATGVAFWFEMDAEKKFDLLNQVNDDISYKVKRDGVIGEVSKKDIVVGDLILLDTGEEIPADGILIDSVSLNVNESTLTGEPMIHKTTNPDEFEEDATYPTNQIYRGTSVMEGHCSFKVTSVGDQTEFGKVAKRSSEKVEEPTPLSKQLNGLAKIIGMVGFTLAVLTFGALFTQDVVHGKLQFNGSQVALLISALVSLGLASIRIWLPLIEDGLKVLGIRARVGEVVERFKFTTLIYCSIALFALLSGLFIVLGNSPFDATAAMSIDTLGRILAHFMVAVTLIVVSVPEGLPMSVTLSLALSMRRMLKTNNLVRKMHATETMGATTVICTDKTGTLTQNQMRVHETCFFALGNQTLADDEVSKRIVEAISLNSTAHLDLSDPTAIKTLGNPTEAALLLWLHSAAVSYEGVRNAVPIVDQLTFSTERKYMATVVKSSIDGKKILYIKGAPEIVLTKCTDALQTDGLVSVDTIAKEVEADLLSYQQKAMRTLGFGYKVVADDDLREVAEIAESDVTFLGFVAISDPVRADVPEAVQECLSAGIQVKIVTGDTPGTAIEIGRQIGIWKQGDTDEHWITGPDFERLSDEEAFQRVKKLKIMCRARPTDKQRLVELLKKGNEVVAVTGDGTNDAPALNHANVGLSMGTGTSVAKEASAITLLDDSFKSIVTAVLWGRSLYQNIQRFILFQLTINVVAMAIVLIGSLGGMELPLTVTQMLWVNLIMDTFAAGALASLPPDRKVMKSKPRKSTDFIITPSIWRNIVVVGLLFVVGLLLLLFFWQDPNGVVSRYDLSRFFTIFVLLQVWNMFNAKAFASGRSAFANLKGSYTFLAVVLLIFVGQYLIVTFGGNVMRTEPLHWLDWIKIIGATSLVLWIGEAIRWVQARNAKC